MSQSKDNQETQENQLKIDKVTWFRHNLDAADGRRFVMLRLAGGYEAHGIFWALVPHLYKYGNRYPLASAKQKETLASQLHLSVAQLEKFIDQCVESEKLLEICDGFLTCSRIEAEFLYRQELSEKRRKSGRKGGQANAKQRRSKRFDSVKQKEAQNNTIQDSTEQNNTENIPDAIAPGPPSHLSAKPDPLIEKAPGVWLTQKEQERLCKKIPDIEEIKFLIKELSSYAKNKPTAYRKNRDHYETLLNWRRMKHSDGKVFFNHPVSGPNYYKNFEVAQFKKEQGAA